MSLSKDFLRTGEKGYTQAWQSVSQVASPGASVAANNASFMPDPNTVTVGRKVFDTLSQSIDQSFSSASTTPMTLLTGRDHTDIPAMKADTSKLAVGQKAGVNQQAHQTAQTHQKDIQQAKGAFEKECHQTQATLCEALDQGADLAGVDQGAATNSFHAPQERSEAGVVAGAGAGKVVGSAIMMADAASMLDKRLSREDECKVAEQVQNLCTPMRDTDGNIVAPAQIANNFDPAFVEKATPKEFADVIKQAMVPAAKQKEMQDMGAQEAKLGTVIAGHQVNKANTDAVLGSGLSADALDAQNLSSIAALELEHPPAALVHVASANEDVYKAPVIDINPPRPDSLEVRQSFGLQAAVA